MVIIMMILITTTTTTTNNNNTNNNILIIIYILVAMMIMTIIVIISYQHRGLPAGLAAEQNIYEEFTRLAETRLAQNTLNYINIA